MQNQLGTDISARHLCAVIIVIHISNAIIFGFPPGVGTDSFLAYLISAVFVIPLMVVYARLVHLMPGKDLFEMMEFAVGKPMGIALSALMALYFIPLSAAVRSYYAQFVYQMALVHTPIISIFLSFFIVCSYLARSGAVVISKWSSLVVLLSCVLTLALCILSVPAYEAKNLLPVMTHSLDELTYAGFRFLSLPMGEAVIALSMAGELNKKVNPYKSFVLCGVFSIAYFVLTYFKNCAVLGERMMEISKFSSYLAASVVEIGSIGTRIESLVGVIFLLSGITKVVCSLYAGGRAIKSVFRLDSHDGILTQVGFFSIGLSCIIFRNMSELDEFIAVYHILALPFQVLIPLIVWIAAEIKVRCDKIPVTRAWKEPEAAA